MKFVGVEDKETSSNKELQVNKGRYHESSKFSRRSRSSSFFERTQVYYRHRSFSDRMQGKEGEVSINSPPNALLVLTTNWYR